MGEVKFRPVCLGCDAEMEIISALGLALEEGSITCPSCGADYNYTIQQDHLTLKLVSALSDHLGSSEKIYESIKQTKESINQQQSSTDEYAKFTVLVKRRVKEADDLRKGIIKVHHLITEEERAMATSVILEMEETCEKDLGAFRSKDDPLFRARLYQKYQKYLTIGSADKEEILNGLDHALVLSLTRKTTKKRLARFVDEFDCQVKQVPLDELRKRTFKFRRHIFQRSMTLSGLDVERLLPKMRKLLLSELW